MLQHPIPFEIHLTTENFSVDREPEFIQCCIDNNAKPLMIELSHGDSIHQPMLSKVIVAYSLVEVLNKADVIEQSLTALHFSLKRTKVEVPAEHAALLEDFDSEFQKYFEWHGKIEYRDIEKLLCICNDHKAHLSHNALKKENGLRFITLREFGNKTVFENRIHQITKTLLDAGWPIIKQQSEYCIYDSHQLLDAGWLPL